jgi:hypothetical protein
MTANNRTLLAQIAAKVKGEPISPAQMTCSSGTKLKSDAAKSALEAPYHPIHAGLIGAWVGRTPPFDRDLVSVGDIRKRLTGALPGLDDLTDRRLVSYLRLAPISARPIRHQRLIRTLQSNGRLRLWVLHNSSHWLVASEKAIGRHLSRLESASEWPAANGSGRLGGAPAESRSVVPTTPS